MKVKEALYFLFKQSDNFLRKEKIRIINKSFQYHNGMTGAGFENIFPDISYNQLAIIGCYIVHKDYENKMIFKSVDKYKLNEEQKTLIVHFDNQGIIDLQTVQLTLVVLDIG